MKSILKFIICLSVFYSPFHLKAQLEKIVVETYYVSNANDSADVNGINNSLPIGSKTYRVYVDLSPGSKLTKLYGSKGHPLKFTSSKNFFNNKDRGEAFANRIAKNRLKNNTVALDTWLTLGEACAPISGKTNNGILKSQDTDGASFLVTNSDGMLLNNDPTAGIALTSADGFIALNGNPAAILQNGDLFGLTSTNDTSIFGRLKDTNVFNSSFCSLESLLGVVGSKPDSNQILVAQLTTLGDLNFELNIEVLDPSGKRINYVSSSSIPLTNDTVLFSGLKYPAACGCLDPNYLEYSNTFSCSLPGSCITPLVLGCMDVNACNFNPNANFPVNTMCCYVGFCNDRDIAVVCPSINNGRIGRPDFILFPNKVSDQLNIEYEANENEVFAYEIYNTYGIKLMQNTLEVFPGLNKSSINVSVLEKGMYLFKFARNGTYNTKIFIKE